MQVNLPAARHTRQFCRHQDGWSDHYGALQVAAAYAGLVVPPRYTINGVWQHGVFGPWQQFHPSIIIYNAPGAQKKPVFVAREDEAEHLRRHGYGEARAIGLPITYAPEPAVERVPRSLLVVPTHSLTGDTHQDRRAFEEYAATIRAVAHHFDHVTVCIHPNCRRNGLWMKEFSTPGIEIVLGAETGDANALLRMRTLFASFEYVTTNEWGSHVAYALAFGARVSIAGQPITGNPALHARDEMWKHEPEAMARAFSLEVAQERRNFLQRLYVAPQEGVLDVAFGRWFIGADNCLSPADMASVLDRLISPAPLRVVVAPVTAGPKGAALPRILFVCHEATRTGAPMFLLNFLRWLRTTGGAEFEILLGKGGPLEPEFAQLAPVRFRDHFEANSAALRRFDLVYSNTCLNSDLLDALGMQGLRVVTHFHELDLGYEWLGARRLASVFRHSTRLLTCAGAVTERLEHVFRVEPQKIRRHYEMVDPESVRSKAALVDAAALRREHGIPDDALVVAACGTVDFRKAPDLFLQVAAAVKRAVGESRSVCFLWIGAHHSADLLRVLNLDRRRLGLENEFKFIGEQSSPHGLISLCEVFCLPSREDPFPLVMLEAGALGKPVVCFERTGGAAEYCATGAGIAVPYLDTAAMAAVCVQLLDDATLRAELGHKGYTAVQERFSVRAVAPDLWRDLQDWLKLQPETAAASLGEIYSRWHPDEAPQPVYRRAYQARAIARETAGRLIGTGQRKEAAQLLVRAVNADMATRDAWIVCEGLVEIAGDMVRIDPRQADLLLAKAREIARGAGVDLSRLLGPSAPLTHAA